MLALDYLGGFPLPKSKASLLQGTLDMLILKALSLGALHGYGVGQRIAQISGDALKIEEGSLYPGLYRLEQRRGTQAGGDGFGVGCLGHQPAGKVLQADARG